MSQLLLAIHVFTVVAAKQMEPKDRPPTDSFLLIVAVLIGKGKKEGEKQHASCLARRRVYYIFTFLYLTPRW